MIKAVIFDVGGVLIRTEDPSPRRRLEDRLGLAPGQAEFIVFNSERGRAAQLGQITSAQLWDGVQDELGLDADGLRRFRDEFFGGDVLDRALIDFIRALRGRYTTAIISNYMDELPHLLTHVHAVADAFDLIVVSAQERIMKPDAEIFQRTLSRLNLRPEETVFIDDFAHNVEGALAVGMRAIHFTPGIEWRAALAGEGVEIGGLGD
ncbi:MAG: HAD family phosphatase [Caldilineaceae bacterium]|nr:HAD family phosphatase [Caldilineaceae bacterium]